MRVLPLVAGLLLTSSLLLAPGEADAATSTDPSPCDLAALPSSPALTTLRQRLADGASDSVRMVALGSSTTYGMDLADPTQRWTDRLMADLIADGVHGSPTVVGPLSQTALSRTQGVLMVNAAVPGAMSETDLAEYLPGLLAARATGNAPSIVFHVIGSNDYWAQVPPLVFGATLRTSLTALDAQVPRPIQVIVSTYEDPARTGSSTYQWSQYGDQMRAAAAADPQHRLFIDLSPWFHSADVPGTDPDGYLDSGGVHPSAKGQAMIATLLMRALGYGC